RRCPILCVSIGVSLRRRDARPRRSDRQAGPEQGSTAWRALDLEAAAVVAQDPKTDRQAEAGPLPDGLGGEKRLEDTRHVSRPNAAAVVLDLDNHASLSLWPRP